MAQAGVVLDQDQFTCSVCLDVLREPVTIPCGHSYCSDCIRNYWDQDEYLGVFMCPQCRQSFSPRPALARSTLLADVVDRFKRSGLQEVLAGGGGQQQQQTLAEANDVECDVCPERKNKAVSSCLVCLASYCQLHVRPHHESAVFKKHKLVSASKRLQESVCPRHDKLLEVYCRTDKRCICSMCLTDEHKGHDTVLVEVEIELHKKKLQEASLKCTQNIKDVEKELRYVVRYIKHATEAAEEESDRVFSKLLRAIEKQRCDVKEAIRGRERAALAQTEQLLEKLERETAEVRRSEAELEKLCRSDDHLHFLQKCKSLHFPSKRVQMPNTDTFPYLMYKTMRGGLAELRDGLDESLQREFDRISDKVVSLKETSVPNEKTKVTIDAHILYDSEPKTREEFLHYYQDLTLDPNTANPYLSLSEGHRAATTRSEAQPYPEHPERFSSWAQVLCRAGMAGRCYWEVAWAGKGGASVGVCYRSMSRSGGGSDSKLGHNPKSWSLDCSDAACTFRHNKLSLSVAAQCGNRIGVYLDFRAGVLSFYNVSEGMLLLHGAHATFSQPVFPGFWVGLGSTLKLCSL
ncbi:E3 ubiquitin/ISG15 ligase TRIM25-like isoform X3 [Hippocampus zosterae]|uniref:E3 ubiquitin/ISG15 ligase TRIM25-like isoform X3 n=1 Tax=Hippocampus zosterae TaxID=109293 RepID=UPI00223D969F|nr:E3 ubiquitin/ISG15 ligase TRIM25-like isoform X3 [Hippocampus zosterae]